MRAEEPDPGSIVRRRARDARNARRRQITPSATFAETARQSPLQRRAPTRRARVAHPAQNRADQPLPAVSDHSRRFLRQHYPGISIHDWNDWKWQVRNRIRRLDVLEKIIDADARRARRASSSAPATCRSPSRPITCRCCRRPIPMQPLRRTHIPVGGEFIQRHRRGPRSAAARTTTPPCPASSTATPTACCS